VRIVLTEEAIKVATVEEDGEIVSSFRRSGTEPRGTAVRRKWVKVGISQRDFWTHPRNHLSVYILPQTTVTSFSLTKNTFI
jgi:hypothetical protein